MINLVEILENFLKIPYNFFIETMLIFVELQKHVRSIWRQIIVISYNKSKTDYFDIPVSVSQGSCLSLTLDFYLKVTFQNQEV